MLPVINANEQANEQYAKRLRYFMVNDRYRENSRTSACGTYATLKLLVEAYILRLLWSVQQN